MKVITFTVEDASGAVHGYREAERMIMWGDQITTTQMVLLNNAYIPHRYDIIRIIDGEDITEIRIERLGPKGLDYKFYCDKTTRELRYGHNLYNLWNGGEFLGGKPSAEDRLSTLSETHDDVR